MKCPHCGEPVSSISCQTCGEEIPEKSLFCLWCGNPVEEGGSQVDHSERVPCPDGTCIGTLNEKGVCNICGKPYAGNAT